MFEIRHLCVIICLLSILALTDALFCYSCATSSAENSCLTNWKSLRNSRMDVEADSKLNSNVKNCTVKQKYCSIEKIENRGELVSYIRDCSDGTTFSTSLRKFQDLAPDNQTSCEYSGNLICVTLCNGDFCNGPSSAAGFIPNMLLLALLFSACRISSMQLT